MALYIYPDVGMTTGEELDFMETQQLIAKDLGSNTGFLYKDEDGYAYDSNRPFLGIELDPLVEADIDVNNVYIKIYPKDSGPGTALLTPEIRKIYEDQDFEIISDVMWVSLSPVGPNSDVAVFVGTGDAICMAPKDRGVLGIIGAIGTSPTANTPLWVNRVQEGGINYAYDYLQMYVKNTFVLPPRVAELKVPSATTVLDSVDSQLQMNVSDGTALGTMNPDTAPAPADPLAFDGLVAKGCTVYWGNTPYASILNGVKNHDNSGTDTHLALTLSRIPGTLTNAPTTIDIRMPETKTYNGVVFNSDTVGDNSGFTIGTGFAALQTFGIDAWVGYAVTHLGKFIGTITEHTDTTVTLDSTGYSADPNAAIPEESDLIFMPTDSADQIQLALDNAGSPDTFVPVLDLPAITDNAGVKIYAQGTQQVKAKPFISPNFQIIVTGLAFPETV